MLGTLSSARPPQPVEIGIVDDVRVLVLADTHLKVPVQERFAPALLDELERAELIVHAGDVTTLKTLESLHAYAPVIAVLGNNDSSLIGILEPLQEFALDGIQVAVIHDSGSTKGRAERMHRRFPTATLVIYGHSHVPDDSPGIDGQRLFNPGSATTRRAQPYCSYGILVVANGALVEHRIEPLL